MASDNTDRWPANPFSTGAPLELDWFVGRQAERERLSKAIRDGWSRVFVRGPRGMGKTTLVRKVLADTTSQMIYLDVRDYVDARDISRPDVALRKLIQGLVEEIAFERGLPADVVPRQTNDQDFARNILPSLSNADHPRLIFVLDEVDFLDIESVRHLVRYAGRAVGGLQPPLWVFVFGEVWGGNSIDVLRSDRIPEIEIGLLSQGDLSTLLERFPRRGLFSFHPKAQLAIWEITAGHPLFVSGLLDAIYDMRWLGAHDRRAVSLDEVEKATTYFESHPSERVAHAIHQAGPAVQRVLRTLADEGRELLTSEGLREIFRREWPGWEEEIPAALNGLRASAIVLSTNGAWSHRIPVLKRYFAKLDRSVVAADDRPPRPDAWALFHAGDALALQEKWIEALDAYHEAINIDDGFWLSRWHLAQLLIQRAAVEPAQRTAQLTEARELLQRIEPLVVQNIQAHQLIRTALCTVLIDLADMLPASDANRLMLIKHLRRYDVQLETPKARRLVADSEVARWVDSLWTDNPAMWRDKTRRLLREFPEIGVLALWQALTQWLVPMLDKPTSSYPEAIRVLQLVRYVLPVLVDEQPPATSNEAVWEAFRNWTRRASRKPPEGLETWFDGTAWETFLLRSGPGNGERVLSACNAMFEKDCRILVARNDALGLEQLVRIAVDPEFALAVGDHHVRTTVGNLWSCAEELVLLASEAITGSGPGPEPLGRMLLAFELSNAVAKDKVRSAAAFYITAWADIPATPQMPMEESAFQAWAHLLADMPPGGDDFLRRFNRGRRVEAAEVLGPAEKERVAKWLFDKYVVSDRVAISLPGLSREELRDVLRAYVAHPVEGEADISPVLVRTFRLRSPDTNTANLMKSIWDRERRALASLSRTPAGRALLTFREAHLNEEANVAILVTDWVGTNTVRDELRKQRPNTLRARWGRVAFWKAFGPIVEAVEALHRNGFLHRMLSPEVMYIPEGVGDIEAPIVKLCHFEWSVYLRGLSGLGKFRRQSLNRYTAPESLRAALGIATRHRGETFASDLYALGITLFEVMIRPLRGDEELQSYNSFSAYGEDEEAAHARWLAGLRTEVDSATTEGRVESREQQILKSLLHFQLENRPRNLTQTLTNILEMSYVGAVDFTARFPIVTTLPRPPQKTTATSEPDDPRLDPRSIAYFLRREHPAVESAGKEELAQPQTLSKIVTVELQGATVFENRHGEHFPLLLRSRTGLLYRLRPLRWDEREHLDIAFLEVARSFEGDELIGEPLGVLSGGVEVLSVNEPGELTAFVNSGRQSRLGWRKLFERAQAEPAHARGVVDEREITRQRLLDLLALSTEVEYALAWSEVPFVRAKVGESIIEAADGSNLATTMAGWLARDLIVEVAKSRDVAGRGLAIGLDIDGLDLESGLVDLTGEISPENLPDKGVVRPSANRGVSALYRRRQLVLRQIRDDTFLLDTVADPSRVASSISDMELRRGQLILPELDDEKLKIVERFLNLRPLLAVQGPPGTGKTTLAAEVLLQTLRSEPTAKILVAAQGHGPLDNVLERLLKEKGRNAAASALLEQTEVVRIPSGRRTDAEYPESVRPYFPFARAEKLYGQMLQSIERGRNAMGLAGTIATALGAALGPYVTAPDSLRRRIEEGANVVFLTTNARAIETAVPGSFDLAIVEEAARCVPIEMLSAMRLAKRWLLIGDQAQLPPFGFDDVVHGIRARLMEMVAEVDARGAVPGAGRPEALRTEQSRLASIGTAASSYMKLFEHLHSRGSARTAATLKFQWRMHPTLGDMVSDVFYDGSAVMTPTGTAGADLARSKMHPFSAPVYLRGQQIVWIDFDSCETDAVTTEGRGAAGGVENIAERRTAVAFLRSLQASRRVTDIAILSPYRRQVEQFRGLLRHDKNQFHSLGVLDERVFTVDSFQGRQAGTVVLSLVRNNSNMVLRPAVGFLADKSRCAVMFSRAERLLVILGCSAQFARFRETEWITRIWERAEIVNWREIITSGERHKLASRK